MGGPRSLCMQVDEIFSFEPPSHVEAFLRMCVPFAEVLSQAFFAPPFSAIHPIHSVSTAPFVHSFTTSIHPPTALDRRGTLLHHLRRFYGNTNWPFALSSPCTTGYNFPAPFTSVTVSSAILIYSAPPARRCALVPMQPRRFLRRKRLRLRRMWHRPLPTSASNGGARAAASVYASRLRCHALQPPILAPQLDVY